MMQDVVKKVLELQSKSYGDMFYGPFEVICGPAIYINKSYYDQPKSLEQRTSTLTLYDRLLLIEGIKKVTTDERATENVRVVPYVGKKR